MYLTNWLVLVKDYNEDNNFMLLLAKQVMEVKA